MKRNGAAILAALGMAVLILDAKTALAGANEGIRVCVQTVVPSLFPFFVLSILLNGALTGRPMAILSPIARLLQVPQGAVGLITVGLLGGYPVGAQGVGQAHREGRLVTSDARRMLAFCSNAGPAFIFGMGAGLFPKVWVSFLVWAIHILSSWCVALLTPCGSAHPAQMDTVRAVTLPQAVRKAVVTLATVCGWVVLFRVLIAVSDRWLLWAVSGEIRAAIVGALELANGCCALPLIECPGLRMTAFAGMLSFGGLCVAMQTASVVEGLSMELYLPGKLCQSAVSILLSIPAQLLLPREDRWVCGAIPIVVCCTVCVGYRFFAGKTQKSSSIPATAAV